MEAVKPWMYCRQHQWPNVDRRSGSITKIPLYSSIYW